MKLFEEFKVGNLTLKNRVVLAPMGNTTDTSNSFNMRDIHYFEERAKGGCGLILTGAYSCRARSFLWRKVWDSAFTGNRPYELD